MKREREGESVLRPTDHALRKEESLQAAATAWEAPTDAATIPWASEEEVPVIDLAPYFSSGSVDDLEAAAASLRAAAHSTGFHFIVGHGVSSELVASTFRAGRDFHSLPEDVKASLSMDGAPDRAGVGYLAHGNAKLPARPKKNMNAAFVVKNESGPRDITLDKMPWPDEGSHSSVAGFRHTVERYCAAMSTLACRMLPVYAVALGLRPHFFSDAFKSPLYRLRLSKYAPTPAGEYGINPHVDTTFFTILRPSGPGLVVQRPGAAGWMRVPHRGDDSFVVNFGELLSQVTNDSWPATRHYALNYCDERVESGDSLEEDGEGASEEILRFALPFFFNATPTFRMSVVPTCCSAEQPPKYPPLSYLEGQGVAQGE